LLGHSQEGRITTWQDHFLWKALGKELDASSAGQREDRIALSHLFFNQIDEFGLTLPGDSIYQDFVLLAGHFSRNADRTRKFFGLPFSPRKGHGGARFTSQHQKAAAALSHLFNVFKVFLL
jgi:hypothetical protein